MNEETAEHVLLQCTSWIPEKGEINRYFHTYNIQPELTNLLGLNPSLPKQDTVYYNQATRKIPKKDKNYIQNLKVKVVILTKKSRDSNNKYTM
jgi:hypothetical protein